MKQKTIKKWLASGLVLAMAAGLLAGCGTEKAPEKDESVVTPSSTVESSKESSAEKSSETVEEPQETVEIVWHRNISVYDDVETVEAAINEYIEPLIGVKVDILNSKTTDLKLALAANENIDLFWSASWSNGDNYINDGAALCLDGIVEEYEDLYNSIPEHIWEASMKNGSLYFVPVYKESATGYGVALPKELVEKYNFDISKVDSLEDMTPYLKAAYEDGIVSPFTTASYAVNSPLAKYYTVESNYAVIDASGKVMNMMETEEFKDLVNLMYEWNQAGYINQDEAAAPDAATANAKIGNGESAMIIWANTPDGDANASNRMGIEMVTIDLTGNVIENNSTFGSVYMINSQSEEKEVDACMKLLELLSTDQTFADLVCYGVEGKHYKRTADDRVELIDGGNGYKTGVWATASVMAPSLQVGDSSDKKEQYDAFNKSAAVSPWLGFVFDETSVEAEMAACDTVIEEYASLLERGFYDPEEYLPKYQAALKKAGIDKIIAEKQAQFDAWRQNKK